MSLLNQYNELPYLGFGLGLRPEHYEELLAQLPALEWLEVISENYLVAGGKPLYYLDKIRESYPLVMHGVSLSLGSTDPLDWDYLKKIKQLAKRIEPAWISDHLCWTGINGLNMHDLLPLPYTKEAIKHLCQRINQVQDYLGQAILIENVSSYLNFKQSELSEWDFISEICRQSGCYLLLDVNNVYVSAVNHEFSPLDYINALPLNAVAQIHLAGHCERGDYIIDTHDATIIQPVWNLYKEVLKRFGPLSTLIERDDNIPPLNDLLFELNQAKKIAAEVLCLKASHA